jgi:SAM-dependent methyltransferase
LDIGAADGSVARILANRGCRVWGIEADEQTAIDAALVCEGVTIGDVEQLDLDTALSGARFDVVLLLDVLEHFREPLSILRRCVQLLAPGGQIIASIPNITHGAVRLSLLQGRFTYTDRGLLDRTHLRFFDREAIDTLFSAAHLDIQDRLRVVRGLTETEIQIDLDAFPSGVVKDLAQDAESTTYQFVIVATLRANSKATDVSGSLSERLQRRLASEEARFQEVEAYARSLEQALALPRHAELTSELTKRMGELHQRELELRHLRSELAVKEAFTSDLRQALTEAEATLKLPDVRLVVGVRTRLRRFPRLYNALRRLTRWMIR